MIKFKLFKAVNGFMAVFCAVTMLANHVGVNVLNSNKASSSYAGDVFEYQSIEQSFSIIKNGKLLGTIPTDKTFQFKKVGSMPALNCNAIGVGVAALAGATTGGAGAVGGAALAGGAAMLELPGGAAVGATLGGAGVAAGEAAAAAGAMTAGAAIATVVVPVLIGAAIFAGIA